MQIDRIDPIKFFNVKIKENSSSQSSSSSNCDDDLKCPITLELMKKVGILTCGHAFEYDQIAKWVERYGWKCPKRCHDIDEKIIYSKQLSNGLEGQRQKICKIKKRHHREIEELEKRELEFKQMELASRQREEILQELIKKNSQDHEKMDQTIKENTNAIAPLYSLLEETKDKVVIQQNLLKDCEVVIKKAQERDSRWLPRRMFDCVSDSIFRRTSYERIKKYDAIRININNSNDSMTETKNKIQGVLNKHNKEKKE